LSSCTTGGFSRRAQLYEKDKRVLRILFRPIRNEATGGWRKLHDEELHNFYSSSNRMMKSRRVK
jgi:hypothetical protein